MAVHRAEWRHCPRCAAALAVGPAPHEPEAQLHCSECGLAIYDNPAPTASALVVRDRLLLLTRRARAPFAGDWDVPGGFVHAGEDPRHTVRRELAEETGLTVEPHELLGIFGDTYGVGGVPTLNIFYRARVLGGVETPADDVSELGWFSPEALPLDEIAFRNGREAIEALLASGL